MDVDTAFKDVFGLDSFRPGQRVVVEAVLSGRHAVAVEPKRAGKALCYQLPAVVTGGTKARTRCGRPARRDPCGGRPEPH